MVPVVMASGSHEVLPTRFFGSVDGSPLPGTFTHLVTVAAQGALIGVISVLSGDAPAASPRVAGGATDEALPAPDDIVVDLPARMAP